MYGGGDELTLKRAFAVSGSEDGKILWWDVVNKNILAETRAHDGVVLGVDTREDGLLISCGTDKTIKLWCRDKAMDEEINFDPRRLAQASNTSVVNGFDHTLIDEMIKDVNEKMEAEREN